MRYALYALRRCACGNQQFDNFAQIEPLCPPQSGSAFEINRRMAYPSLEQKVNHIRLFVFVELTRNHSYEGISCGCIGIGPIFKQQTRGFPLCRAYGIN